MATRRRAYNTAMPANTSRFSALLLDIDGVIRHGPAPVPGAVDAVRRIRQSGLPLRFVTNTSTKSRRSLCAELQTMGFDIEESMVFSAPAAVANYLRNTDNPSCFLIAKGNVAEDFAGISLDSDRPAAVVVGGAEENFTYEAMNRAFQLLLAGAELIAIHRNAYWRVGDDLWLDAGAYVAALEFATRARAKLFGKPAPDFFSQVVAGLEVPAHRVLMIGDDAVSDVAGAQDAGLAGALVQTGKFRPQDLERPGFRPDLVATSISALVDHLLRT